MNRGTIPSKATLSRDHLFRSEPKELLALLHVVYLLMDLESPLTNIRVHPRRLSWNTVHIVSISIIQFLRR